MSQKTDYQTAKKEAGQERPGSPARESVCAVNANGREKFLHWGLRNKFECGADSNKLAKC
ncbi:MAG: hypothetical protein ACYSUC_10490 [Planctomycetota bacterium]